MRNGFGHLAETPVPAGPDARAGIPVAASTREIPYDYVARFELKGESNNRVQDVINVSTEGIFVAVAVGYSFLPPKVPYGDDQSTDVPLTRAREGIRRRRTEFKNALSEGTLAPWLGLLKGLGKDERSVACVEEFARYLALRYHRLDFLYSVIDSGSGRELQNQPIHNLAGLGNGEGDRPFRMFARPILFQPRSSIRIEIIEQTDCTLFQGGQLYFVLHGYKLLGAGAGAGAPAA